MKQYLLAIDQGTTSSRAMLFNRKGQVLAKAQQEFSQHYPKDGWVEHDPEDIWKTVEDACRAVLEKAKISPSSIAALGITNQRETTILWDRKTGKPIYPAIVWQDRRTTDYCHQLLAEGHERLIQEKTGLLLDPYFSATKIRWILDRVPQANTRAKKGELAFGTIDTFLLWRLTEGRVHATDATNASRTLLFNIQSQSWDQALLKLFDIPEEILPTVYNSADDYGETNLFGASIPITALLGDQQAAAIGQACFEPGMVKSTYGTGCFMLLHTGQQVIHSKNRLLSTVAYRLQNKTYYALEGSIFIAGAAVQWLRDVICLIGNAKETEALAASIEDTRGVYLVPAFTGLGAPYWDPEARGAIFGLTRDSGVAQIVRAALEAVCYQSRDLLESMKNDGANITSMRVDGGMVNNQWLLQYLADILQLSVQCPFVTETTALGAAYFAGLQAGLYTGLSDIAKLWQCELHLMPQMSEERSETLYQGWLATVERVLSHH